MHEVQRLMQTIEHLENTMNDSEEGHLSEVNYANLSPSVNYFPSNLRVNKSNCVSELKQRRFWGTNVYQKWTSWILGQCFRSNVWADRLSIRVASYLLFPQELFLPVFIFALSNLKSCLTWISRLLFANCKSLYYSIVFMLFSFFCLSIAKASKDLLISPPGQSILLIFIAD